MRTVVLGIGNLLRSDDGVGIHAIQRLRKDPLVPQETVLVDGGTSGLELLADISGFDRLLLIDALDARQPPGTIVRLDRGALGSLPGSMSVHQLAFADLLVALRLLDDQPDEVIALGVQPLSTDWGIELSPPVRASFDGLIATATEQLRIWSESERKAK